MSSAESIGPARTSKSERTRQRILDAAAYVLSRRGYAGTRLADVAERAEVRAPAIYYYFASKDELVEEVMWAGAHYVRLHVQEVLAGLPADLPPMDRVLAAVDAHLRYELRISDYTTASVRNAGQVPEHLRDRPLAEEASYSRLWRGLLADAEAAGQLRDGLDVNVSRLLVLGAMNWAAEWWNPRQRSLDDLVAATQALVLHGMGRS